MNMVGGGFDSFYCILSYFMMYNVDLDPLEQAPLLPILPPACQKILPMLWAARSATALKKWPLLRLLWKAAPRKQPQHAFMFCLIFSNMLSENAGKCHSKDVEGMVEAVVRVRVVTLTSAATLTRINTPFDDNQCVFFWSNWFIECQTCHRGARQASVFIS